MKITIDIKTDNAAFEDNPWELLTVLKMAMTSVVEHGEQERALRDSNGNSVGSIKVTGK